jgi:predicted  nucleic acid-binding Zn-ribbon protein
MTDKPIYHVEDDKVYILVEADKLGREKENLKLTIQLAREKIEALQPALDDLDDDSEEYDALQEQINDYEMLISDCEDRFEDLINIPR